MAPLDPATAPLTEQVIGCAFAVSNALGAGFLEKVYENALALELAGAGLAVEQQKPLQVRYRDRVVGEYFADLCVEDQLIVELKCVRSLEEIHAAQCLNYLKATRIHTALLLNFQAPKVEIRRIVL
jgi:GxxExxY protein